MARVMVAMSGGVDSSWVLLKTIELGLRPLAVHMDNGWNSELAQNNIANLVRKLDIDLYTHVINWTEYRDLMQAFFDADVVDIELLYDNALQGVNYQQASKFGLNYILSGVNKSSEGMLMPRSWHAFKFDKRNIKSIARKYKSIQLDSFPSFGTLDRIYFEFFKKIKWISFLDYLDYDKFKAMSVLKEKFGYKPYPYKHYESIFTRFYQGYILPKKFGIDKRRIHFSTLIIVGQMDRDTAIADLSSFPYSDEQVLEEDIEYFLKKMKWSRDMLDEYICRPRKEHIDYGSEEAFYNSIKNAYLFLSRGY